jgi:hypothetical protein
VIPVYFIDKLLYWEMADQVLDGGIVCKLGYAWY